MLYNTIELYRRHIGRVNIVSIFQEMKYNNSKKFEQLNNRYTFNSKFKIQEYLLELHEGKQGKRILGHNNYKQGKSVITIDHNEIRNMVNDKHGTGQIVITRKGVMTSNGNCWWWRQ